MSSAAKDELGDLLITARELVTMRQTLIEMGRPQPPTPIQTDNSTSEGGLNETITARKNKSMDLRFHWLRCRKAKQKFRFYWAPGSNSCANYSTKHHLPIYHELKRPLFCMSRSETVTIPYSTLLNYQMQSSIYFYLNLFT